jgi:hypothetical protein
MNIWAWVYETQHELREAGHGRLADLMDAIPEATIADRDAEVEAIAPEAIGLARSLELPWVEIFVRHWQMQASESGFDSLPDAVDLLELSHRDANRACPQSVCTVQDLSQSYAAADGPGYAQERLDVSAETLDRIDSSWPCFACISGEHAHALLDADRPDEAMAFIERQLAAMREVGNSDVESFDATHCDALLATGRPDEVLRLVARRDRAHRHEDGSTFARSRRLRRTLALLDLGRAEEAREALLPLGEVMEDAGYFTVWARAVARLVEVGLHDNDWRTGPRSRGC